MNLASKRENNHEDIIRNFMLLNNVLLLLSEYGAPIFTSKFKFLNDKQLICKV